MWKETSSPCFLVLSKYSAVFSRLKQKTSLHNVGYHYHMLRVLVENHLSCQLLRTNPCFTLTTFFQTVSLFAYAITSCLLDVQNGTILHCMWGMVMRLWLPFFSLMVHCDTARSCASKGCSSTRCWTWWKRCTRTHAAVTNLLWPLPSQNHPLSIRNCHGLASKRKFRRKMVKVQHQIVLQ